MNWSGKRILLTGHTGFKGSWLSLWLQMLGADVCGLALAPHGSANLFEDAKVGHGMRSVLGDIRDADLVRRVFEEHRPEIVFHLAAQPLVRAAYQDPLYAYAVNVMGTAHVLDAVRQAGCVRAAVIITTDKCYENREWVWPYRETDRLGGYDPYSNSKACAELVVAAYRNSFFPPAKHHSHGVALASVRAGNVIGGGDWAEDRLIPDIMRAFLQGKPVRIRNPRAIRPWQHVLEPLRGYLKVAEALFDSGAVFGEAWNFGPRQEDARPVDWIVRELAAKWDDKATWDFDFDPHPHEAQTLRLDCSKASARLGWEPLLDLRQALELTVEWYRARRQGATMDAFTGRQIQEYRQLVDAHEGK